MATYRKRGKGYELIYQVDGQRHFETVYAKNDTEAHRELDIRVGQALEGRAPTTAARQLRFEDLATGLESEYRAQGRKSADTLKSRLENLKRHFGGRHALSITTSHVHDYIGQRLAEGASPSTVRAELAKLKRMFNLAVQSERLQRKPYIPMPREANPRKGFFEQGQFQSVVAALPDYLRPVAEFGYYTGWRRSEITSLLWDQVDLRGHSIRLWAGTTKNGEGRFLPLDGELWRIIEEQRKSPVVGCPYVFHRHGRRIGTFYKAWAEACREAQCPGMLFHDFRRTAARNLTKAGLSESQAMMITGHKTREVFRRYNIVTEGDLRNAIHSLAIFRAKSDTGLWQKCGNDEVTGNSDNRQETEQSVR
jgi:integrase